MKLAIIFLLALSSCATMEPVQVKRCTLTLTRIESHHRHRDIVYMAVWEDKRGVEYQENLEDTLGLWIGKSRVQMLKR